ncbi:hypothetical protein [Streptomyces omiyaensis]|uniref:Uncharacterized protein n=1 Tax=Streptomyces omiyaensis TaxID=68247 RepID=A0ABW7BQL8_9ACTN
MAEPAEPTGAAEPPAAGAEEKPAWEQTMEDLGLGIVPAAYNLFTEGGWVALATAGAVAAGAALVTSVKTSAAIAARTLTLKAQSLATPRNEAGERMVRVRNPESDYGGTERRRLEDVLREARAKRMEDAGRAPAEGAGGGAMAPIPADAKFGPLRYELKLLNPLLEAFNKHAPDFVEQFRKLPGKREAGGAAKGVEKVAKAVKAVDHRALPQVASGMGKIKGAVLNSDPQRTTDFAKAIGKLKSAMRNFDVDNVPKAATLGPAADAAEKLATHTTTLTRHMRGFAEAVQALNREMTGGAGA